MYTITVTSLADSGTGTLREAIALANAYTGTDEIQILIDESLAGQTIELSSSLPSINKACSLIAPASGIVLSGYGLTVSANLHMENITQTAMAINRAVTVSGSGNVFTGSGRVIYLANVGVNLSNLSATATQVDAYIGITDSDYRGTLTLNVLGDGLDTYRFNTSGSYTLGHESVLILSEGVKLIGPETEDFHVRGKLTVEGAELKFHRMVVWSGEVDIRNSKIETTTTGQTH